MVEAMTAYGIVRFSPKLPGDSDPYTLDYTQWLATLPGDSIVSAVVSASPAGLILVGAATIAGPLVSQTISASQVAESASPWVNFEAGGAWVTGRRVIPCCVKGMKPTSLPVPLSHLQGLSLDTNMA